VAGASIGEKEIICLELKINETKEKVKKIMCLGIPMKIVEIKNNYVALAETMGVNRIVRIDMVPGVAAGDYVLVHAGFAMEVIDTENALERIKLLESMLQLREEA